MTAKQINWHTMAFDLQIVPENNNEGKQIRSNIRNREERNMLFIPVIRLTLLTPCSRVLLQNLTGSQLVEKSPAFHRTRRIITAFTRVRQQLSLSWAHCGGRQTAHDKPWNLQTSRILLRAAPTHCPTPPLHWTVSFFRTLRVQWPLHNNCKL